MIRIGLTGGIACGKSTVAEILRQRGFPVVDADQVAREVVAPGTPGLQQIVATFGPAVLAQDGSLDRRALRERVATDVDARRALEAITHPLIRDRLATTLAEWEAKDEPVGVVEAALLVEGGSWRHYDVVVVVSCSRATQIARLRARNGWTDEEAGLWIDNQMPLADKERVASVVLRNDGDLEALRSQVDAWAATLPHRVRTARDS